MELARRSDLTTSYQVEVGDTVRWKFAVESHDVGFGVVMRKMRDGGGGSEEVAVVPSMRVDASMTAEGTWVMSERGTVVLKWDNTYSMLRSKSVAYSCSVQRAASQQLDESALPPAAPPAEEQAEEAEGGDANEAAPAPTPPAATATADQPIAAEE